MRDVAHIIIQMRETLVIVIVAVARYRMICLVLEYITY